MARNTSNVGRGVAAGFFVISLYILFSIITALQSGPLSGGFFAFPGSFLVRSFRYAAFYIPVYLVGAGFILLLPGTCGRYTAVLFLSLIPFLTAGLFFQVLSTLPAGSAARWVTGFFGRRGGALILLFLFLLEAALILRFVIFRKAPAEGVEPPDRVEGEGRTDPGNLEESEDRVERENWTEQEDRVESEDPLEPAIPADGDDERPEHLFEPVPIVAVEKDDPFEADGELLEVLEEIEEEGEEEPRKGSEEESWKVIAEEPRENTGDEYEDEDVIEAEEDTSPEEPDIKPPPPVKNRKPYDVPLQGLLDDYPDGQYWIVDEGTRKASEVLKNTLEEFKISAEVTGISKGPVITMFEILPAPGVKLSKIVNLADNIALRLAASRVRIVAPIPGKHAVGIEVPNRHRAIVSFKEMLEAEGTAGEKMEIPVILGKDIAGGSRIIDLVHTPHLLIAGATGSGKSVCVNSIICSVLYNRKPAEVRIMLIDPKIVELKLYNDIPHLLTPVITEPKRAFQALQYCIYEMERRYSLLDNLGVRDIRSYNRRVKEKRLAVEPLPYILIIIDEFADLMATTGKEMEATIARLAAMSRAVGLHLVLATQRPSVDVITGLIKANIPSRIAFMVAGKFDSRIIIDQVGAEKLLGRGDMLFTSAWDPNPVRIQGAFLSEEEVERITDHVRTLGEPEYIDDEIFFDEEGDDDFNLVSDGPGDPLMDSAVSIVIEAGKASASYLQRRLKIGYNRAARLVEQMEDMGIVGPANGSKPRDILHVPDRYL